MNQFVIYAFGQFQLNTVTQLLCYEDSTIRLQPKIYRLLLFFLQNSGKLISKKELINEVWQGRVVEDTAVRLAVTMLRKVLHDEIRTPRYILTSTKNGYRFLAEVKIVTEIWDAVTPSVFVFCDGTQAIAQDYEPSFDDSLSNLFEAFQSVTTSKRKLVFLKGKQGSGKTALIEDFLVKIKAFNFDLLRARCVFLGKASEPFLPIMEALERRCLKPNGNVLVDSLLRVAPTWLYPLLNTLSADALKDLCPKISHMTTGRMLREGADFFESLAEKTPFIVIVDNCHWCDEFTLDLLNLLAFRCSPAKLLVVISYRPDNTASTARIEAMHQELNQRNLCVQLSLENKPPPIQNKGLLSVANVTELMPEG